MEAPLWTDVHAPALEELPQPEVRDYLTRVAGEPINLLVHGPRGAGKTAAVRALCRRAQGDTEDLVEINVSDFFGRTKKEIREDPRFSHFLQGQTEFSKQYRRGTEKRNKYKRDWSKRDMIGHVLKEFASYTPSSGEYKTVLLDNAEAIREDFQQALRRVMERHGATQFVIATRQPSKLIPAIRSRCAPVPVRAPTTEETTAVLSGIAESEGVPADRAGLGYVASYADGDLRRAVLAAQSVAADEGEITRTAAYEVLREVGPDARFGELYERATEGEFTEARSVLDDLLVDEGLSGGEVLRGLLRAARGEEGARSAELARLAGEVDLDLATGTNDRLHLAHFLARIAE